MPRRNLYLLTIIALVAFICHQRANSAHHSRYARMFDTFSTVMDEVEEHYVQEVDREELFRAGLEGMLGKLDQYSQYIPPTNYREFKQTIKQEFGGIGIQVSLDQDTKILTVLSPLVGTPAYSAGMRAGDQILEIDGHSTEGFTLQQAVDLMRGKPGDVVHLVVRHKGEEGTEKFSIARAIIKFPTVLGDSHNPDGAWNFHLQGAPEIGYIRINAFSEETVSELQIAMQQLTDSGMKGLVLDLRNNPGGLLDAAVEFCDMFIDEGVIVSTRGRDGKDVRIYEATAGGTYTDFPMAVLVNGYSASASEIVAACLQDHGRAVIVGERSYGKGSVQNVIPLERGNSALKLTVASYWRPSGKNIHRFKEAGEDDEWGVMPSAGYAVKLEGEELEQSLINRRDRDILRRDDDQPPKMYIDPQLQKALDYLQEAIAREQEIAQAA